MLKPLFGQLTVLFGGYDHPHLGDDAHALDEDYGDEVDDFDDEF